MQSGPASIYSADSPMSVVLVRVFISFTIHVHTHIDPSVVVELGGTIVEVGPHVPHVHEIEPVMPEYKEEGGKSTQCLDQSCSS